MPGIPREFAEHSLQLFPEAKPVKQTMRRISGAKRTAVESEVDRLLAAGFIREIKKSQWVANPVLVEKKHTDILRMCVDFTALNKCCPKDHFPLPRIDQICGDHRRMHTTLLSGCLLRLSPDKDEARRRRKNGIHNPTRGLLLPNYALWAQKCGCNILAHDAGLPQKANRTQRPALRG